jgi:hypothetical protein
MKKYTLHIAFFLIINCSLSIVNCNAQPNPGFENWTTTFGVEDPDGWQTQNFLSLLSPPNPLSAFKVIGVDVHSGNYALKLKTVFMNNNPDPSQIHDTMGITFTGKVNPSPFAYILGYPYTGRPEKLEFWAKYTPVGNDTGGAYVYLIKQSGTSHDTIAGGEIRILPTTTYTLFQLTLTYLSTALPDSAVIGFSSSHKDSLARVGSTLFVDDVALTGWVGIDQYDINNKVKVFPNPAKYNITISTQINDADNIQLIDISGKLINDYKIQNYSTNINTSAFAEGIYFYEVRDKTNCILTKGKFNVVK